MATNTKEDSMKSVEKMEAGDVKEILDNKIKELESKPVDNSKTKLAITPDGYLQQTTLPAEVKDEIIEFQEAEKFDGARDGFVFKMGDKGLGYYSDQHGKLMTRLFSMEKALDPMAAAQRQAPDQAVSSGAFSTDKPAESDEVDGEEIEVEFKDTAKWGITARMSGGPIVVTKVKEGGQGQELGIQVGDVIASIEGVRVSEQRSTALQLIRGGGNAKLVLIRPSTGNAKALLDGENFLPKTTVAGGQEMVPDSVRELSAMLGTAKAQDTVTVANESGQTKTITDGSFSPNSTLVFFNCTDCNYKVETYSLKVYFQGLKNCTVTLDSKILTATIEAFKCENVKIVTNTKCGTFQADMCDGLDMHFNKKSEFGMLVWAGCEGIRTSFGDDDTVIETGFSAASEKYASLNKERSQFKISEVHGKILEEPVVRLANGFTTTAREKAKFDLNQEAQMQVMAKNMGITIKPSKKGIKVKPNETCPCGSGRKFKKCCNSPDGYWTPEMAPDMYKGECKPVA